MKLHLQRPDDITFAIFLWTMVLGPPALAIYNWSLWYLLLWFIPITILGMI